MKTRLRIILFTLLFANIVSAQNCTVRISDDFDFLKKNSYKELELFLSLEFEINNIMLKTNESNEVFISPNTIGFDTIKYSFIYRDSIHYESFICKLKSSEIYTISPCTCCGIFLMTPSQNAQRGYIKYVNNSKERFIAETGELQIDTVYKKRETDFIYSFISMNCGFRPNTVFVAELGYLDKKFEYENLKSKTKEEQELLKNKQQDYIRFSFNYLFLHGERLVVTIDKTGKLFDLTIKQ